MAKRAIDYGKNIADGSLDPMELLSSVYEKTDVSDVTDDIFTVLTKERAEAEAQASRKRRREGNLKSPLDGVPISWKDLFDTKGTATEAGSKLLEGRTPKKDCLALKRATDAGMICMGKTHMSELAFSGLGINPNAKTPPNINGADLAPGGSSSGAGASVAHGFVPIGVGSDTGGSVRIPAAWNNLVGLKTTHGLIPNYGVVPLCPGFDTVGPLCTSVEDAWISTAIFAGMDFKTPEAKPLSECKFLVCKTITRDGLGEDQETGFSDAVAKLATAGASVDYKEIDILTDIQTLGPILFPYEAWQTWGKTIEANPELMFEPVKNRFLAGKDTTREQYETAWHKMLEMREIYHAQVADYDAVLAPSVAIGPPSVSKLVNDIELFQKTNLLALRNTRFFNMFGTCALTLPTSRPASGLMVVGKPMAEKDLISVGLSIEEILNT